MATALAAASAGWTETVWRDVLASSALSDWAAQQRRKGGGLRHRNPADVDHRLATTWRAATRRAAERPPVADAPSVRAELAALLAAADHNPGLWAGAAGVTDRAVLAALVERNGFDTADVDDVVWGTSSQVCEQSGDLGRMGLLDAGYDVKASGVTLDRFCGSGITANNIAATAIMAGMEDLVIAGGTEMMSLPKKGLLPMGANNKDLQELHPQPHQGVCADAIATPPPIEIPTKPARATPRLSRRPIASATRSLNR